LTQAPLQDRTATGANDFQLIHGSFHNVFPRRAPQHRLTWHNCATRFWPVKRKKALTAILVGSTFLRMRATHITTASIALWKR
jgi:hypothetical protein